MIGEIVLPSAGDYPRVSFVGKSKILARKVTAGEASRHMCSDNDEIQMSEITAVDFPKRQPHQ